MMSKIYKEFSKFNNVKTKEKEFLKISNNLSRHFTKKKKRKDRHGRHIKRYSMF